MKVARLGRPTGLKGYLGLYVEAENLPYFETGSTVIVTSRQLEVVEVRSGAKGPEVKFVGINSRDQAEELRGSDVFAVERRPLSDGEYWPDDLVGLVVKPGGGVVASVVHGPGQDRLVIERSGHQFEIPFVDDLVPVVDIPGGFVEIAEIEGITEL